LPACIANGGGERFLKLKNYQLWTFKVSWIGSYDTVVHHSSTSTHTPITLESKNVLRIDIWTDVRMDIRSALSGQLKVDLKQLFINKSLANDKTTGKE